jgi:type IV fimbrial biogenesis protein FimT
VFQTGGIYTAADFIQGGDTFSTPNVLITADTGSFNFGGLGRTNLPGDNVIRFTYPTGGNCVAGGGSVRCLNVVVKIGGQIRMCDPAITTPGDTRAC